MLEQIQIHLSQWIGTPHDFNIKINRGNNTNFDKKEMELFFFERNIILKNANFDELVERYQIDKWKRSYNPPKEFTVCDGIGGEILLTFSDKTKKIHCNNMFPKGIDDLFNDLQVEIEY